MAIAFGPSASYLPIKLTESSFQIIREQGAQTRELREDGILYIVTVVVVTQVHALSERYSIFALEISE